MVCSKCGTPLAEGSRFCKVCGGAVSTTGVGVPVPVGPQRTSGKAIASLVSGLFSFLVLPAIAAVILGHLALSEIKKSARQLKGEGLAIAGLVLGYLGLVSIPFILIIAAIAIPNLLRARIAANESSAVAAVRKINAAEVTYANSHADIGFTCALSDLLGEGLIDASLASGTQSGYVIALQACALDPPGGPNARYQVVAYPAKFNQTGVRAFCSDESAGVRANSSGSWQDCVEGGSVLQ